MDQKNNYTIRKLLYIITKFDKNIIKRGGKQ